MFYVYVIQSIRNGELYIGYTADLKRRFLEHNQKLNSSTKADAPWKLIYYEACLEESDAKRREKYLKTTQGGRLLKKRIKDYLYMTEKFNPVVKIRQRPWRVAKQAEFLLQGNKSKFHYGVKISRLFLVTILVFSWIFSGWPPIWQNPRIPPKIQKVLAALPGYRSSGTFTAGTGAITPPYPVDMAANDVCLLAVSSENQAITLTTANGFVEVPTWSPQGAGTAATDPASMLALYWKRTVGGDSAPVVADSINNTEGQIHCFTGVITSGNPWDTGAGGNDSAANDTTGTF